MASSARPRLSLGERLDFGVIILSTVLVAIRSLITSPFRGDSGNASLGKHVLFAALRNYYTKSSARQLQSTSPNTTEVYLTAAKSKGFEPRTIELEQGAKALWIGGGAADKIVVLFHGGGFVLPASTHLDFAYSTKQQLGSKTAVVTLAYSLAPDSPYPAQLQQAVALLRHLIETEGRNPENIILAGDSAGGNLVLGVLGHILHPHPRIDPLRLAKPFQAVALVSPWGDFSQTEDSFQTKQYKDVVNATLLTKWSNYFMGDAASDGYNQPFQAPPGWWNDVATTCHAVLITAGSDEVLTEGIQKFAEALKKHHPQVNSIVSSGEFHDQVFLGPLTGDKEDCESKKVLLEWLKAQFALLS